MGTKEFHQLWWDKKDVLFCFLSCCNPALWNFSISSPASAVCSVCFILHLQPVKPSQAEGCGSFVTLSKPGTRENKQKLAQSNPAWEHASEKRPEIQTVLMREWKKTGSSQSLQLKEKPKPRSYLSWKHWPPALESVLSIGNGTCKVTIHWRTLLSMQRL